MLYSIGEPEDPLEEQDDEDGLSSEEEKLGSENTSNEDESPSSSEVDSVFGSDLDADDEDLTPLRKSAGLRGKAARCDIYYFFCGSGLAWTSSTSDLQQYLPCKKAVRLSAHTLS